MAALTGNVALNDDDEPSNTSTARPPLALPQGFDDEADFLADMRRNYHEDMEFDRLNRESALEDLRFLIGDQWDDISRQRRESARKPILTINRLPAFIAQVVGTRRLSETTIKIVADTGGSESVARVREGLVRSIQKISRADIAYDKALEGAVSCGIGNFQIDLDYSPDDVWDKEIRVTAINDSLAVVWDRTLTDLTGADAKHCFVVDVLPKREFEARWPWATPSDVSTDITLRGDLRANGWIGIGDVRVVSYWRVCTKKRVLALMNDGSTRDITDEIQDPVTAQQVLQNLAYDSENKPVMREANVKYAQKYVCSGLNILEGPFDLPISRVPVFRVSGWEMNVGEFKHRWGLVRFLKDPQRLHNFWRSVVAEKIMQSPRNVWLAASTAVEGREKEFRNSHLTDDPLLVYNAESGAKPERIAPAQLEPALMEQAALTAQDIKDVSNIHEANLGMPSNEVSGVAIQARQRVSDTGTVLYHDNLNQAIEQCGVVMDSLISFVYDTPRIIKVLGEDAKQDMQVINAMGNPHSVDITVGKYSVSAVTGTAFATKRIEAVESMMTFINAAPQVAGYTMDLVAAAMDWPLHEEFARRIRMTLPPGMIDPKDMTPQMQQSAQAQQQKQGMVEQLQAAQAQANLQKTQAEAGMNAARARNFEVQADVAPQREQTNAMSAASQAATREANSGLAAVKIAHGG